MNAYGVLASEYYLPIHKTSRNFDATTLHALAQRKPRLEDGLVLEVGCGRGRVGEFLGIAPSRVVQLDLSREMLSLDDRERCALRLQADATNIPLFDSQFAAVVGFLSDAFLGLSFFFEANRMLNRGGGLVLTTPSHEWGEALRGNEEPKRSEARFKTNANQDVIVPSTLFPASRLEEMLKHSGFEQIAITRHCLPAGVHPISPDIELAARSTGVEIHELPILYLISAYRS
jgi:SAM-dependent methyltransferase